MIFLGHSSQIDQFQKSVCDGNDWDIPILFQEDVSFEAVSENSTHPPVESNRSIQKFTSIRDTGALDEEPRTKALYIRWKPVRSIRCSETIEVDVPGTICFKYPVPVIISQFLNQLARIYSWLQQGVYHLYNLMMKNVFTACEEILQRGNILVHRKNRYNYRRQ